MKKPNDSDWKKELDGLLLGYYRNAWLDPMYVGTSAGQIILEFARKTTKEDFIKFIESLLAKERKK